LEPSGLLKGYKTVGKCFSFVYKPVSGMAPQRPCCGF
jgi:hypothetical protein